MCVCLYVRTKWWFSFYDYSLNPTTKKHWAHSFSSFSNLPYQLRVNVICGLYVYMFFVNSDDREMKAQVWMSNVPNDRPSAIFLANIHPWERKRLENFLKLKNFWGKVREINCPYLASHNSLEKKLNISFFMHDVTFKYSEKNQKGWKIS